MILQRNPWRGCVAAVLAATAFQAAFAAVVWGQSGAATDRAALEALYDATGGENWTNSANWKTDAPLEAWYGVTTDDAGRVWLLELADNGLSGPIPDALGSLANLGLLWLGSNALSGPIPDALGRLVNLESLFLAEAWGLSGPLPPSLRSVATLARLDIQVTQACAPAAWRDWLKTIVFRGRLCGAEAATVDVAVVYTPAAREAAGGAAAIEAVVDLMIAETNQAYEASGVRHRVALADMSEVQYVESGSGWTDVYRLREPSDGHMDEAHVLRDRVWADLVHLITDGALTDDGGVAMFGLAFGLTTYQGGVSTFAHELGHNFRLEHDRYQVHHYEPKKTGVHPGYGYVNQPALETGAARSRRWLTIMAYRTQCADAYTGCSELLRFSNPRQQHGRRPPRRSVRCRRVGRDGSGRRGRRARHHDARRSPVARPRLPA